MKYVYACFDNEYYTGDENHYYVFNDDTSEEEIYETIENDANKYFEEYSYIDIDYNNGWDDDGIDENHYYNHCTWIYQYITEEEYNENV